MIFKTDPNSPKYCFSFRFHSLFYCINKDRKVRQFLALLIIEALDPNEILIQRNRKKKKKKRANRKETRKN